MGELEEEVLVAMAMVFDSVAHDRLRLIIL